jgi:hypothetical protein
MFLLFAFSSQPKELYDFLGKCEGLKTLNTVINIVCVLVAFIKYMKNSSL